MVDGTIEPGWQPLIVDRERRAAIAAVIVEIVEAVHAWRGDHATTSDEDTDYATLRIYTATDDTVPDPDDETGQALASAIAKLGDRHEPGLYGGAARVAFAVGHLSAGEDADMACEMIERSLLRFLAQPTEVYDLISGLVGIAVPVLQRIADGKPSQASEPLARGILDQLERLARPTETGIAWFTPPDILPSWQREIAPEGYTNLGLAHGVPGVVAILARYLTAGVDVPRVRVLLDGAVDYLRSAAGPTPGSRYAAWLPARAEGLCRVAWCYGDLGVAVALMAAANATGRSDWRGEALELARDMAARPFESSLVSDAGLCHGAAGVAHLFNRLAQSTGDTGLARAADAWFARTLAMRRSEPIAGFPRALFDQGGPTWEPSADLLTGAVGIALALHAAISPIEPAWDQILLADLSPTPL
ncbi:MAG: Lanthionine biosynthesis cyclase LanC [Deltaproteobacteria bacterium]|nr:MAG: Lanthionine biosynthesis cyclase LanC [Deltaproteobacteria bacterium]TMQ20104.1 MAG: Lanthionine biosynthesis cyclase LanC [Deltaproteobacteria bacterium]